MQIITSADSKFWRFIPALARSVKKYYRKKLKVYDIGLADEYHTDAERVELRTDLGNWRDMVHYERGKNKQKCQAIKTTHKPIIIRHALRNGPVIYVDADTLFRQKVDDNEFDVGVCLKPKADRYAEGDNYSSYINAGVMFWNTECSLLEEWSAKCQEDTTDQKAMVDLLSQTIDWNDPGVLQMLHDWNGTLVRVLDCRLYNDYHLTVGGKIWHFKGILHDKYEEIMNEHRDCL